MSSPWPNSSATTVNGPSSSSNASSGATAGGDAGKVRNVQRQADAVADLARENIKMSLNQLERLEDMENKALELESQGRDFHRGAVKVRRKFCYAAYRNIFLILIVLAIIGVVLYFIIHDGAKVGT